APPAPPALPALLKGERHRELVDIVAPSAKDGDTDDFQSVAKKSVLDAEGRRQVDAFADRDVVADAVGDSRARAEIRIHEKARAPCERIGNAKAALHEETR